VQSTPKKIGSGWCGPSVEQLRDAFPSHHGTELILARMRGSFGKANGASGEEFFGCPAGCTTLGEECIFAPLEDVRRMTDAVTAA